MSSNQIKENTLDLLLDSITNDLVTQTYIHGIDKITTHTQETEVKKLLNKFLHTIVHEDNLLVEKLKLNKLIIIRSNNQIDFQPLIDILYHDYRLYINILSGNTVSGKN